MCFGNEHLSAEVTRHNSSAMTLQLEDKPHQYLQKKKTQNQPAITTLMTAAV